MAKQTRASVLHRQRRVQELFNAGLDCPADIAERLTAEGFAHASERTIQADLQAIGAAWHERTVKLRHNYQMRKTRDAERRNVQLEAEWQRSKKDKERNKTKLTAGGTPEKDKDGKPVADEIVQEDTTEGRIADVALLAECRKNDEFVARLLGLEEPKRTELSGPDGAAIPITFIEVPADGAAADRGSDPA